jgi:ribulose-phosphate 3-epimerase
MAGCSTAQIEALRSAAPVVAPSLLACDFANIEREVRRAEEAGAKVLHLDIMDGHFVPNLSFGLPVVEAIRRVSRVPLDVHLMIERPGRYVRRFREAGADFLTIHIEEEPEPAALLEEIRGLGAAAGLSLNPPTAVASVEPYLERCDQVLVMSVMPGFGGQTFDPAALEKLRRLRAVGPSRLWLSVDGGVAERTIARCVQAGAQMLVVGTAFFGFDDYRQRLAELNGLANSSGEA